MYDGELNSWKIFFLNSRKQESERIFLKSIYINDVLKRSLKIQMESIINCVLCMFF